MAARRHYPGDFDHARERNRRRHFGAVILVDRCAFCGRLVMAGQTACWRCTEAMRAPWPDDEVTEVGVVPLGLK
jgi:uncharacterized OB-fold protein